MNENTSNKYKSNTGFRNEIKKHFTTSLEKHLLENYLSNNILDLRNEIHNHINEIGIEKESKIEILAN